MGPPSEIGPIDPMIPISRPGQNDTWIPAQSIRDALKVFDSEIAEDQNRSVLLQQPGRIGGCQADAGDRRSRVPGGQRIPGQGL